MTAEELPTYKAISPGRQALRRLLRHRVVWFCLATIFVLVLMALFAPLIAPYRYDFEDTARYVSVPSKPDSHHWLGTDNLGRDVLSRLIYGSRVSLGVSIVTVLIEVLIGLPLGLIAGYYGGRVDLMLMRLTDVMFAFPDLLLAILLMAILNSGTQPVSPALNVLTLFLALGIVSWPPLARLVRGQAAALRHREFVEAARAIGVPHRQIVWRHILPNLLDAILIQTTQDVAGVIIAEATLSFLGLGVQPPYPSWGRMIFDALSYKETFPLMLIAPCFLLAITVMAFNFLGDALRDALDPRQRGMK
ncbi:ABC-type dipeptide/oligopeptide/nickel transport system, permease component [Chthonomonas calidirosea]|uniref:ABC-type dipeptide/oligopeptide/nickel transport systems, permease components n=1 Tax=Chthonomonas calidirosea (strain DSM 23976 / ICMP 18418 / T49) TaxID=1303518 RepID=S0EUQ6_CHTCT|nr:ABC transporter permease [Chthonomonas calidirosea]CCW35099.1 ABC-type dipeptide/oligopeptide/nickel transport systems, permease components [Chthonomonas calidirosea T49]CEK20308.1 ABC-type dipeptide/oligopeptide/nickel transport system, permease component [Chthonomonas calidirosea]CEK20309.1 ABC-type dipeptide/oligopeptide/nickel transport system, permease component [Chthonomonas calidirosea]CEK20884.1 ABC-type dipeptide/oligopeptide/nickel transport system, permease component [Chthonomonas